jgi:hypothetical protein
MPTATIAPTNVEVRFRDRLTGLRLFFHPDYLVGLEVQLTEAGGTDQIRATVAQLFDAAFAPAAGSIMEVVVLTDPPAPGYPEPWPRWRGILSSPEATLAQSEQRSLLAYGFMEDMTHVPVDGTLIAPGGGDLSLLAMQAFYAYVAQRPWLQFVTDVEQIGVSRETLDVSQGDCRQAMDAVAAQAPGLIVWGWRVDPLTGANQFVFKARTAAVGHAFFVGANVQTYRRPIELTNVNNAIRLTGGKSNYPNLLGIITANASFERCEDRAGGVTSGTMGDLLNSSTFVDLHYWTLYNGSSYKSGGLSEGPTYVGPNMVLLDNPTEGIDQTRTDIVLPPAGTPMQFFCYARLEHGTDSRFGTMSIAWVDGAGATVGADPASSVPVAPTSAGFWYQFKGAGVVPAGAAGFRFRIEAGGGVGGLLIGAASFFNQAQLYAVGWETVYYSDARFQIVDPRYPDAWPGNVATPGGDGGRTCIRIKGNFSDTNNHDGHLQPAGQAFASCSGNQTLNFTARLKRTPGAAAAPGKLFLEVHGYKSDRNSRVTYSRYTIAAGAVGSDWTEFTSTVTLDSNAAFVTCFFTFRGDTDVLIDCAQLRDAAAGTEYISGENWERRITAESVCPVGSDAYNSAAVYDRREGYVRNDALIQWDTISQGWALAYMTAAAVPPSRAQLELSHEAVQQIDPLDGTLVRVAGLKTPIPDDYAARATYQFIGPNLSVTADLGGEPPSLTRIIAGGRNFPFSQNSISAGGGGATVSGGTAGAGGAAGQPGGSAAAPLQLSTADGLTVLPNITQIEFPAGTLSAPVDGVALYTPAAVGTVAGTAVRVVTADTVMDVSDGVVCADCSAGPIIVTLPVLSGAYSSGTGVGRQYTVPKVDSTGSALTLQASGSDSIRCLGVTSTSLQTSGVGAEFVIIATATTWIALLHNANIDSGVTT